MHVLKLVAQDFKRLRFIDITPPENVVTITGKNAQGKSSVLDAVLAALGGGRTGAQPDMPIRKGAKEGKVVVHLGHQGCELIATRTWKEGADGNITSEVWLENPDGARFPQAQTRLNKLIGELSFDPLAFVHMKPREQYDALAKNVEGVNLDEIAALNKGDFDKRTDVNRRAKEARAAAGVIVVPEQVPEKIDTQALVAQLAGATQREQEIARANGQRAEVEQTIAKCNAESQAVLKKIGDLKKEIEDLEARLGTISQARKTAQDALDSWPPPPERIDSQAVANELNRAQATNQQIDEILKNVERRASLERLAASLETESEQLTKRIEERNAAKNKAISEAKMPVDGIGFGDGEILLNGVPFSQASSAEQLRTSAAIAAAMNPKLKVIHIRDGSLLDDDSKAWFRQFAKDNGLQVWVEVVGTDGADGILIEEGAVKAAQPHGEAA